VSVDQPESGFGSEHRFCQQGAYGCLYFISPLKAGNCAAFHDFPRSSYTMAAEPGQTFDCLRNVTSVLKSPFEESGLTLPETQTSLP
jgi:hypothetical protein